MGLFDNLFKAKPDAADEAVVEAAKRIAEHEKARLSEAAKIPPATPAARSGIVPTHKPGSVPAPKAYSPRTLGQVVTPSRTSSKTGDTTVGGTRKIRFSAHEQAERPSEVILSVEDVLSRIPIDLISEGPHDLSRELRFKVEDLSADIARGRAAVSLGLISAQLPELFREPVPADDPRQVRLPLQKLVEQIGFLPVKPAAPAEPPPLPELPPPPGPGPAVSSEPVAATDETLPTQLPNLRITLSLAAVLRMCPRELIVAELPPISDEDRIAFPWAPIEKQLASGEVEVSSVRFIFALPASLQGYFEAREGVRVPLPIEEIRKNVPAQGSQAPSLAQAPAANPIVEPQPVVEAPAPPLETPRNEEVMVPENIFVRATPVQPPIEPAEELDALPVQPAVETEVVTNSEEHPLELPPPVVAHAPPVVVPEPEQSIAVLAEAETEALPPIPSVSEIEVPVTPIAPPPIFVPPPLRHSGDTLSPVSSESSLPPPNAWMHPPPELASRPPAPWPPDVAPPPSPILPVRIIAPPVVRPLVAPPPLFGSGVEEPLAPAVAPEPPPPPPRPLDLEVARAAMGLDVDATLTDIGAVLTRLPGVSACLLAARHESGTAGELPPGFDLPAVLALARQLTSAIDGSAESLGSGRVQHFTIFAEDACVSFFTQAEATVCAIHRTRAFLPGVREELAAAAAALAHA